MSKAHKSTRRMMRLRDEFRTDCANGVPTTYACPCGILTPTGEPIHCWLCHQSIDYTATFDEYTNDDRFQLDHLFPVSTHADLQEDPDNFRASHAGCNRDRGNGTPQATLGTPSQDWT